MERRLAAILAADAVAYSRLMEVDEAGALAALQSHRQDLIDPEVAAHRGRIVKLMGDGALVEFASVVDAVACAVAIQRAMAARNDGVPEDRRLAFRIGVHLGDVMVADDDLYGDGVNVAARLEGLAEPGGICISQQALDQVETKLDLTYRDMGEQRVKNIARPVRAYRVDLGGEARQERTGRWRRPGGIRPIVAAVIVLLVVVGAAAAVLRPWGPDVEPVSTEPVALPMPDRPSIAVLPFHNLSDDAEQEYFADGMTEDLITDLSKISGLTVISRTSTSGYKGRQIDIREVGQALDVRYVIEGSVRKAGDRVRINAQLIDATTGGHLWAERYDGELSDIFGLQDQVLEKIVTSMALRLTGEERRRLASHGTDSVAAHDLYLRGLFQESTFTRDGSREAMRLYEQAVSIDPDYAMAYARMANVLELSARNGWSSDVQGDLKKAVELAEKAVALDPQDPNVHWSLGRAAARLRTPGALARGIASLQRAIELDPDFADAYAFLSNLYSTDGRLEDGLRSIETAMRMNPRFPFWYLFIRGMNRFMAEDYEKAIADFEAAAERSPTALFVRWWLAASYVQVGRQDDAEWQVEEMLLMGFDGSIATITETWPNWPAPFMKRYTEALRKAGIPE